MYSFNGTLGILLVNKHRDFYLDHLDVYIVLEKGLKHLCGNTGMCFHSGADYRKLGDLVVEVNLGGF